jgi:hypothetical protein
MNIPTAFITCDWHLNRNLGAKLAKKAQFPKIITVFAHKLTYDDLLHT